MESPVFNPCHESVGPFGRIVGREFLGELARGMLQKQFRLNNGRGKEEAFIGEESTHCGEIRMRMS